jgi:hypothetical protein
MACSTPDLTRVFQDFGNGMSWKALASGMGSSLSWQIRSRRNPDFRRGSGEHQG